MYLSEVFDFLSFGELAHLSIGGGDKSQIGIEIIDYPKVITNINMGLIELHKRFVIKESELTLQLYNQITTYYLKSEYAASNTTSTQTYKYILDATQAVPFQDDIMVLTHVFDELGDEFLLNDIDDTTSLYTPTQNTLQVPFPSDDQTLLITYRASPSRIDYAGLEDPSTEEIDLPDQFFEPLCAYVAYRMLAGMNIGEVNAQANFYHQKFEAACQLIQNQGMYVANTAANSRFGENGWL